MRVLQAGAVLVVGIVIYARFLVARWPGLVPSWGLGTAALRGWAPHRAGSSRDGFAGCCRCVCVGWDA